MAIRKNSTMVYCPMCGFESLSSEFYESINPHHGYEVDKKGVEVRKGYIPYCKKHLGQIYFEYLKKGNMQSAIYFTCAIADIPFIKEVYDRYMELRKEKVANGKLTVMQLKTYNDFAHYREQLKSMKKAIDSWDNFQATNIDYTTIMGLKKPDIALEQEKDLFLLKWGVQEQNGDYELLEFFFDELTEGVEFKNKSEEFLYRDLCIARLMKRKIDSGEKNDDVSKVQTQILKLMSTLKIDNFSERKEENLVERMLESRIAIQEKEKPAFHYQDLKKNEDFLGRGKYFYDHIYRPFHNVLKGSKMYNIDLREDLEDEDYEDIMKNGKTVE